jgi:hypothetical protein
MAGQNGSKGNPASKRMSNVKLKEKRQRSWARGEKRKLVHYAKNEARHAANQKALLELGGAQKVIEITKTVIVKNPKTGVIETKIKTRHKLEAPSTALARTRRELGLPKK